MANVPGRSFARGFTVPFALASGCLLSTWIMGFIAPIFPSLVGSLLDDAAVYIFIVQIGMFCWMSVSLWRGGGTVLNRVVRQALLCTLFAVIVVAMALRARFILAGYAVAIAMSGGPEAVASYGRGIAGELDRLGREATTGRMPPLGLLSPETGWISDGADGRMLNLSMPYLDRATDDFNVSIIVDGTAEGPHTEAVGCMPLGHGVYVWYKLGL